MNDLSAMKSLGVLIAGVNDEPRFAPEEALVKSFESSLEDYKGLILAHTWVQTNYDLIHVEALTAALKRSSVKGIAKLLAGALLSTDQKKFASILKKAKSDRSKPNLGKYLSFSVKIGQSEKDPAYAKFGLELSKIDLEDKRKFRPRQYLLERNPFFKCRKIFGVNWRADVAACFLLNRAQNPTEISKFLGCSYDAAYRNYHELQEIGWGQDSLKAFSFKEAN